jgi:hypothetical protein
MVNQLGRRQGITVVNVVRREAQVKTLKEQGRAIALNRNDSAFEQQLFDACHEHGCI